MAYPQLQVERRTGKVRRPETDVLPLCHATNCATPDPNTDLTLNHESLPCNTVSVFNNPTQPESQTLILIPNHNHNLDR